MVTDSTRQALAVGAVIELVQAQMLVPNQGKPRPWALVLNQAKPWPWVQVLNQASPRMCPGLRLELALVFTRQSPGSGGR